MKKAVFHNKMTHNVFSVMENDPDFKILIELWPKLSVELRKAIIRMVR